MVLPASRQTNTVFFDLGLTLINFEGDFSHALLDSYRAMADSLHASGCGFDPARFAARFTEVISEYYRTREIDLIEKPVEKYLRKVLDEFGCPDLPAEVIAGAIEAMYRQTEVSWQVEADALSTLTALQQRGYRMGLITNASNAGNSNRLIDKSGLREFFKVIVISAEEKIRKPDRRIFNLALSRMGSLPEECVMVGDTLTADIHGAQNACLRAAWLTRRVKHPHIAAEHKQPDWTIKTLTELLDILPPL